MFTEFIPKLNCSEYQAQKPYKFKIGDVVSPKHIVKFCNGEIHRPNDKIEINKETEAYYQVCENSYDFSK